MINSPSYQSISINLNNASPEQQKLFQNVAQFFEHDTSQLMENLKTQLFLNKELKIDVKFQSNVGRAFLEKNSKLHYQITLSSDARPLDTLFDFIHALYDINSRTFNQPSAEKFKDHRFHNAFRPTYAAIQQMLGSKLDFASLGIDNADLEHLKDAIPGQSHQAAKVKGSSVAKDFTLKTIDDEEDEYLKLAKDESNSPKITIWNKKPEYAIKPLQMPNLQAIDLQAQGKAAKTGAFFDPVNKNICCSICAKSGVYSIVTKKEGGYHCARGGYISEAAVLEAKNFENQFKAPITPTINTNKTDKPVVTNVKQESKAPLKQVSELSELEVSDIKKLFEQPVSDQQEPTLSSPRTKVQVSPLFTQSVVNEQLPQPKKALVKPVTKIDQPVLKPVEYPMPVVSLQQQEKPLVNTTNAFKQYGKENKVETVKPLEQPVQTTIETNTTVTETRKTNLLRGILGPK